MAPNIISMVLFHNQDRISPLQKVLGYHNIGRFIGASGPNLKPMIILIYRMSGSAAHPVYRANK